jgi:hypothetical protein
MGIGKLLISRAWRGQRETGGARECIKSHDAARQRAGAAFSVLAGRTWRSIPARDELLMKLLFSIMTTPRRWRGYVRPGGGDRNSEGQGQDPVDSIGTWYGHGRAAVGAVVSSSRLAGVAHRRAFVVVNLLLVIIASEFHVYL